MEERFIFNWHRLPSNFGVALVTNPQTNIQPLEVLRTKIDFLHQHSMEVEADFVTFIFSRHAFVHLITCWPASELSILAFPSHANLNQKNTSTQQNTRGPQCKTRQPKVMNPWSFFALMMLVGGLALCDKTRREKCSIGIVTIIILNNKQVHSQNAVPVTMVLQQWVTMTVTN